MIIGMMSQWYGYVFPIACELGVTSCRRWWLLEISTVGICGIGETWLVSHWHANIVWMLWLIERLSYVVFLWPIKEVEWELLVVGLLQPLLGGRSTNQGRHGYTLRSKMMFGSMNGWMNSSMSDQCEFSSERIVTWMFCTRLIIVYAAIIWHQRVKLVLCM